MARLEILKREAQLYPDDQDLKKAIEYFDTIVRSGKKTDPLSTIKRKLTRLPSLISKALQ